MITNADLEQPKVYRGLVFTILIVSTIFTLSFASERSFAAEVETHHNADLVAWKSFVRDIVGELEDNLTTQITDREKKQVLLNQMKYLVDYLNSDVQSHDKMWLRLLRRRLFRRENELMNFDIGVFGNRDGYLTAKKRLRDEISQIQAEYQKYISAK
jgi:hypothetical protein